MIHLFRAGLPPEIYRIVVREYFDLHRILERQVEAQLTANEESADRASTSQTYGNSWTTETRSSGSTELLLALSVFYRHVIAQFEGAGR